MLVEGSPGGETFRGVMYRVIELVHMNAMIDGPKT